MSKQKTQKSSAYKTNRTYKRKTPISSIKQKQNIDDKMDVVNPYDEEIISGEKMDIVYPLRKTKTIKQKNKIKTLKSRLAREKSQQKQKQQQEQQQQQQKQQQNLLNPDILQTKMDFLNRKLNENQNFKDIEVKPFQESTLFLKRKTQQIPIRKTMKQFLFEERKNISEKKKQLASLERKREKELDEIRKRDKLSDERKRKLESEERKRKLESEERKRKLESEERKRKKESDERKRKLESEKRKQKLESEKRKQKLESEKRKQKLESEKRKQKNGSEKQKTHCPSKNIDPNSAKCIKKNLLLFHPDKNIDCLEDAHEKFIIYQNRCEKEAKTN